VSVAEGGNGVLSLSGLTVERGRRAVVRDVSLDVPAGDVTALLGPNGAGKSSLVLAVGGVLRPLAGSIQMDGRELARHRPELIRRAGVAIVPEGRRLLPDLTVADNIRVAAYPLSGEAARTGRSRALELFPELKRRLSAPARALSGGEQQMLVLAQALVSQPRYILIDELSLGLANHTYVMEGGRLRFSGPASDLRDQPELLRSAYLLRGSEGTAAQQAAPPGPAPGSGHVT